MVEPNTVPADQPARHAAINERGRNLLIDAGAGTGKTTTLVSRLVEMVAPSDTMEAVPIERIAAITFTRKAAGELRLRIRERLLKALATADPHTARAGHLREALAGLDTAYVGTIHSVADRLLRLRPVEAALSPSYDIADDAEQLAGETFDVFMQAVQGGTLAAELHGTDVASRADEATQTILDALDAGMRAESREGEWITYYGLDGLAAGFIQHRDAPPPDESPAPFDQAAFRNAADIVISACAGLRPDGALGLEWFARVARTLTTLREESRPVIVLRELRRLVGSKPGDVTKKRGFGNNAAAYDLWKTWQESHRDALGAPANRWLAMRLVRLFPVVIALYERVKARRRELDELDLLIKLRDLLADNLDVRRDFQQMFSHVFVDEFQDTDPLQAEIVLYLCEREPLARRWEDLDLQDGKLTIVGDPKQSIYRFRRADVAMYDRVRAVVSRRGCLEVTLASNFRSVPTLIDWLNDRFERILGVSPDGRTFDAVNGRVFQQPLGAGREAEALPSVHVLPFNFDDGGKHKVDEYRALEGRSLARYMRWLVESSDVRVVDPLDQQLRRVRYGDIAVLSISTWRLSLLFRQLDEEGIPYASRGGRLFLEDELHRQFLLGLRAIADRDDGVAMAALLRPPFFAIDLLDLARERVAENGSAATDADEGVRRAREARNVVQDLRRRRFDRPPGATARDLLDRTAFARAAAMGPNGTQRLARLRELCLVLDTRAAVEGLDYDAITARMREWIDDPIQLDPPHPVDAAAVQVLTVHQAKGLEFPVVAIWDGKGQWLDRIQPAPWRMHSDGRGWMIDLDGFAWEEPAGLNLKETETQYLKNERRRVAYVAATRARDLLIVPQAGEVVAGRHVCGDLLTEVSVDLASRTVVHVDSYVESRLPTWAQRDVAPPEEPPVDGARLDAETTGWWNAVSSDAARPRCLPAGIAGDADDHPRKWGGGRFGDRFGTTVHLAIAMVLRDPAIVPGDAVARAARRTRLTEHLDQAVADVGRAIDAISAAGLAEGAGVTLEVEYPIAAAQPGGVLLSGYIDFVRVTEGQIDVLDFKTDLPPDGQVEEAYPAYVSQVRTYARLLDDAGIAAGRALRCGLLFTGDGGIRWVSAGVVV